MRVSVCKGGDSHFFFTMIKKRKRKVSSQLDIFKGIRKDMPPPTKMMNPKKRYDRRDRSWEDINENE